MKYLASIMLLVLVVSASAQNAQPQEQKEIENPPSMREMDDTPKQRAEFMAMQIQKVCEVDNKQDLSELLRVCYEFQINMTMDGVRESQNQTNKAAADRDKEIKKIVGSSKMSNYLTWLEAGGKLEPVEYVN